MTTFVELRSCTVSSFGVFPAGWYSQQQDANDNVVLTLISTDPLDEDLPDFTYWWDEFHEDEETKLAFPQEWVNLLPIKAVEGFVRVHNGNQVARFQDPNGIVYEVNYSEELDPVSYSVLGKYDYSMEEV